MQSTADRVTEQIDAFAVHLGLSPERVRSMLPWWIQHAWQNPGHQTTVTYNGGAVCHDCQDESPDRKLPVIRMETMRGMRPIGMILDEAPAFWARPKVGCKSTEWDNQGKSERWLDQLTWSSRG